MGDGTSPARPTMADIARELGVAKITVSRALSNHSTVKESTRKLVRETAERMGYRLNVSARNLRQQRTRTIAVVIEMTPSHERLMSEPYPLLLLGGIMQELTAAGQNMVLTTIDLFSEAPPSADGVILLGQGVHDDAAAAIEATGLPYVVWGAEHGPPDRVVVGSDNREGGRLAADYLLGRGRRRLMFLGDAEHGEAEDRLNGFADALAGSGGGDRRHHRLRLHRRGGTRRRRRAARGRCASLRRDFREQRCDRDGRDRGAASRRAQGAG